MADPQGGPALVGWEAGVSALRDRRMNELPPQGVRRAHPRHLGVDVVDGGRPRYRMTVDLNVLDHLAAGLYSSVAAVLTEAVANAWDADAGTVRIRLSPDEIRIEDDGMGMDEEAVNHRYLHVGFRRREHDGDVTPLGRPVMGRKGIGKLSLLGIADVVEIRSQAVGAAPVGLRVTVSSLREAMREGRDSYYPDELEVGPDEFPDGHGTVITVRQLRKDRIGHPDAISLSRRLARRFSVVGSKEFRVFVDDHEVSPTDRDDLRFAEYVWVLGNHELDQTACPGVKTVARLPGRLDDWPDGWQVNGWIGTVDRPRRLATPEGSLNSIVVLARGRLVLEDMLPRVGNAEVYTKYLTGQVQADFLDDTAADDIVTSDRQRLIEDDGRVLELVRLLARVLRTVAQEWSGLRSKDKVAELRSEFPALEDWLARLGDWRQKAEELLARIATMELDDTGPRDLVEVRRVLLRHAILGFERLRLRGDDPGKLAPALGQGVERLLEHLASRDDVEAALYRDIVTNRLEAINRLSELTDADALERLLQRFLFDHLWLLDPAWERAAGSEAMEERLRLRPEFKDDKETKDRYGRVDIRYTTVGGKHVLVELKRASVLPNIFDLGKQGKDYVDALRDLVDPDGQGGTNVEVIFVLGRRPKADAETIRHVLSAVSPGSSIVTYEQLIVRAKQAYAEFLQASKEADVVARLVDSLQPAAQAEAAAASSPDAGW